MPSRSQATRALTGTPGPDQFERWRDLVARSVTPVEVTSPYVADFTGSIDVRRFGSVSTLFTVSRPVSVDRTRAMIRRSDPGMSFLIHNLSGPVHVSYERQDTQLRNGDLVLLHTSRRFRTHGARETGHHFGTSVTWEPGSLEIPEPILHRLVGQRLPGSSGAGALVSTYLRALASGGDSLDAADGQRLGSATLDLLTMMFGARLDTVATVAPERRDHARFLSIRSFILANLGDPALTPEVVAGAHHISLRSLHRLFQANAETTVARWIRDHRLAAFRADLRNPDLNGQLVSSLTRKWGLSHPSYAARAFKAAYGLSPAEYRMHQLTGPIDR